MKVIDISLVHRMRQVSFGLSFSAAVIAGLSLLHWSGLLTWSVANFLDVRELRLWAAVLLFALNLNQLLWLVKMEFWNGKTCLWVPISSLTIFGISFLFFAGPLVFGPNFLDVFPKNHAPTWEASLSLILLSGAQFMFHHRSYTLRWINLGPFLVLIFNTVALIGFLLNVPTIYVPLFPSTYASQVPQSAILLGMLSSLGILFSQPDRSFMNLLASPTAGGLMVRKLFATLLIAPLSIGVAASLISQSHFFDFAMTNSLAMLTIILTLIWVIWTTARQAERADLANKDLQQKLLRSHELVDLILSSLPVGVCFADVDGHIVKMNRAAQGLWGTPEKIVNGCTLGAKAWSLETGERAAPVTQTQIPVNQMLQVQPAHGPLRMISSFSSPLWGSGGDFLGTLMVNVDVSDTVRLERQNRLLARSGFELMQTSEPEDLIQKLAHLPIPDLCDRCYVGFGSAANNLRWSCSDPSEAVPSEVLSAAESVFSRGASQTIHYNGFQGLIVPMKTPRGRNGVICLLATISGRTFNLEIQHTAEELGRLAGLAIENSLITENLEAAIQAREDVCAIVSHDLRNPLGAVMGMADLLNEFLLNLKESKPEVLEMVRVLRRASRRMHCLVSDLLEVAKLEKGVLQLSCQPTSIAESVQEIVDVFRAPAQAQGIQLKVDVPDQGENLVCDPQRLFQVLSNLVSNSLKHTPTNGRVGIRVRILRDGWAQFTVEDNGAGIDSESLPHIFDRYWQPHASRSSGAGLGLYICKGIIEGHQGRIWAESEKGKGTCIHFTLPTEKHPASEVLLASAALR